MSDTPSTTPAEERTLNRRKLLEIGAAAAATPAVAGVPELATVRGALKRSRSKKMCSRVQPSLTARR